MCTLLLQRLPFIAFLFCLSLPSVIYAAEELSVMNGKFSGNATFASDYVFRGESETANGQIPAIQASLTWTHNNGSYAGVFGSTNKFETSPDITAVIGPYIGKSTTFTRSGLTFNGFVFHYMYPGANQYDYTELWLKLSKSMQQFTLELELTPTLNDWFGVAGWKGVNYAIHPKYQFERGLTLNGSLGYQDLSGESAEGWVHWNLGLNQQWAGLAIDLRYHDSNVDENHKVYGNEAGLNIFKSRIVFGVSKAL